MPETGYSKPQMPPSGEYEKLRREAEQLRQLAGASEAKQAARTRSQGGSGKCLRYAGIGVQFLVMMGLAMLLGWWIDGLLGTRPWLMVAGAVLGMTAAMVFVVR